MRFCCQVYREQLKRKRHFLHAHRIEELEKESTVQRVRVDMCKFGMVSRTGNAGSRLGPVKKPISMLTNSPYVAKELSRRCPGDHEHVHLLGGRAVAAQVYPAELCRSVCKGIVAQKSADHSRMLEILPMSEQRMQSISSLCMEATNGKLCEANNWPGYVERPIGDYPKHWSNGIHDLDGHQVRSNIENRDGELILKNELSALMAQVVVEHATHDVSGASLDPAMVRDARRFEMKFFNDMSTLR